MASSLPSPVTTSSRSWDGDQLAPTMPCTHAVVRAALLVVAVAVAVLCTHTIQGANVTRWHRLASFSSINGRIGGIHKQQAATARSTHHSL